MSLWSQARKLALQTPEARNRYVDFLRAVSIGFVVLGHWIIAAPSMKDGRLHLDHMLGIQPWTQWLTLLFQVMPIFFLVGGYSNAASWDASRRKGESYGVWMAGRARRLIGPLLPLVLVWGIFAAVGRQLGIPFEMLNEGSKLALVPTWFLAVYMVVCSLVPLTRAAWQRFGMGSYWVLVAIAVGVDFLRFGGEGHWPTIGWINYPVVWLAVHQLGYLWRDGRLAGWRAVPWGIAGVLSWTLLARFGPYPISMVGVPGEEVSNTLPPDIMLLALGAAQVGILLMLEGPMRRLLAKVNVWTSVVLINGMIMSIYLWHMTSIALAIGVARLFDGIGLHEPPGSGDWWLARIPWLAVYVIGLIPLLLLFGRFERLRAPEVTPRLPVWRVVPGLVLIAVAIASVTLGGIAHDGGIGVRFGMVGALIVGALLVGVPGTNPFRGRAPQS
ncbi:hypothetical protein ABI59_22425 [Acidobacteria bacterium Mor1]|nr:hypothetical protein ABI59_22425 [Acidobacteria bacterium Mor1]